MPERNQEVKGEGAETGRRTQQRQQRDRQIAEPAEGPGHRPGLRRVNKGQHRSSCCLTCPGVGVTVEHLQVTGTLGASVKFGVKDEKRERRLQIFGIPSTFLEMEWVELASKKSFKTEEI